jgi:uncharacterized sulfatase
MDRRQFLALSITAAAQTPRRLNVIFMVADDMNCSLGSFGNDIVKTPNLDKLAERGVRFHNAHCQFPLCAPSRASFLSGRRPESTKVWTLNTPTRKHMADTVMLPELFRKNGYYTANLGKIFHTGPEHDDLRSWDFVLPEDGKNPPAEEVLASDEIGRPRNHTMAWAKLKTPDEKTPDGIVAREAVKLIEKAKRPFFLGVGFRRPHSPYAAPAKYFDPYTPSQMPLPYDENKSVLPAAWYELADKKKPTEDQTREFIAAYYASISFMDAQAGAIFDALTRLKLWDSTIVVFLGDNGYHNGEHGMWHKMTLFEESTRVPLIIASPRLKGEHVGLAELIDIYPTLAELCGLKPPAGLEGKSLMPVLKNPRLPGKPAVYTMVGRNDDRAVANNDAQWFGRSVRTEQWRYTEWDGGKRGIELYNIEADPGERKNLAASPALEATRTELRKLLRSL